MSASPRSRLADLVIAALLGGAAFVLYTLTLAPSVLAGDGGEFQIVPYLLGVAHPTGYPLYCLLGWAWSHLLPLSDPSSTSGLGVAYRMNLFSAFWAALAVGLLYPTARTLLRQALPALSPPVHRLLAALVAATFAVTPTLWSQAIIAEVYGLHTFFVVLLLYLVLTWGERAGNGIPAHGLLLLAAGCFGLSLAHHSTTLLLAPALVACVWLTDRRALCDWRRVGMPALLLVLVPLLLYLYIPLRAPHTPYLRQPLTPGHELVLYENTLPNLLSFVTGGPFGGSVDFSVDLGARLAQAWSFLLNEVSWVGAALALIGLVRLALSRRWALLAVTGLACVAVVAFNLVYTIGDIFVLYIPAFLIVVLWMGVGAGSLLEICKSANAQITALARAAILLASVVLPGWMAVARYADVDQSQNTQARSGWEAILAEPLPPDAVLVSNDRNDIMPLWYLQYVDRVRPDLMGLYPLVTPEYPTLGHVLDLALSTGRPVYLIKEMPGVEVKVRVEAEGRLWRVLGPAAEGEPGQRSGARLGDVMALVGYDWSPRSPRPGEVLHVRLTWEALRPLEREYHTFVHLLDAEGQKAAQSDRQPGGVYYPTTLWQPGERLRDEHALTIPADAAPGVYQLLVGMYAFAEDGSLEPLGEPVITGEVAIR